jgi:hypothetical protein
MQAFSFWVLVFILLLVLGESYKSGRDGHAGSVSLKNTRGRKQRSEGKRIAVIWTSNQNLPPYFDLTVATLLNGGARLVDIHMLVPEIPTTVGHYLNRTVTNVFFHQVTSDDWIRRIREHLKLQIDYDFKAMNKKTADLKPMYGLLFQDFIPQSVYGWWVYGDFDGFFGSYDQHLDYNALQLYDVISGMPMPPPAVRGIVRSTLR